MKEYLRYLSAIIFSVSLVGADPLINAPGTKAKAMGGAFTAVANNNSAMYYNPAGLVLFMHETTKGFAVVSMEFGSQIEVQDNTVALEDKYATTGGFFFGSSLLMQELGLGFALYSLFDVSATQTTPQTDPLYGKVSVISISAAYNIADSLYPHGGKLSIGTSLAYAGTFGSLDTNSSTNTNTSNTINTSDSSSDFVGVSGTFAIVGLKYQALNTPTTKLDLGINYRSAATLEDTNNGVSLQGIGIPAELAYGIAFSYGGTKGVLTLAADLKNTAYADATSTSSTTIRYNDAQTTNFGIDYSTQKYQLRMGSYKTVYNNSSDSVEGFTFGFGITNKNHKVDFQNMEISLDQRKYYENGETAEEILASLSFNLAFH